MIMDKSAPYFFHAIAVKPVNYFGDSLRLVIFRTEHVKCIQHDHFPQFIRGKIFG